MAETTRERVFEVVHEMHETLSDLPVDRALVEEDTERVLQSVSSPHERACPTCTAAADSPPLAPGEYARIQESLPQGARIVHQKYLDDLTAQIHRLHEELGKERRRNAFSPREILEDAGPYFLGAVLRRWGEVAAAGIVRRGEIGREIGAEIADRLEERP